MNFAFHEVQWRHFSGVVDRFKNTYVEFFSGFCVPKIIQIGLFFMELIKNINVVTFLGHTVDVSSSCCYFDIAFSLFNLCA